MEKFLKKINWDDKEATLKDCQIHKVLYNKKNKTTTIVIATPTILSLKIFELLQSKVKKHNPLWDIEITPRENSNNLDIFNEYLEYFSNHKPIGNELRNICNIKLENNQINIYFNFKQQMKSYLVWKEKIESYFNQWGFNFKVAYILKENKELKKAIIDSRNDEINSMRNNVVKKDITVNSDSNLSSSWKRKINYDKFSKESIANINQEIVKNKIIEGNIFYLEKRLVKNNTIVILKIGISDGKYSIFGKMFSKPDNKSFQELKEGEKYFFYGHSEYDQFERENVFKVLDFKFIKKNFEIDDAKNPRVEISAHTRMSAFDGIEDTNDVIKYAMNLGHKGIIICDQDNVQSYPDIQKKFDDPKKGNFKIGCGVILKTIEDELAIIKNPSDEKIDDATYIVFDLETTGLSSYYDEIIEFAATKIKNNLVIEQTSFFVKTSKEIAPFIQQMTKINKKMLEEKGISQEEAAKKIKDFIGNDVLVAHNAGFDIGFLEQLFIKNYLGVVSNPWIDTLHLSWVLTKPKKSYRLKKIAKEMLVQYDDNLAHRADYDVNVLQQVFLKFLSEIKKSYLDVIKISDLAKISDLNVLTRQRGYNTNIIIKNQKGVKDLYKLVSLAHTKYLNRGVKATKECINKLRENLLIGSGANDSEIIDLALTKNLSDLEKAIKFYDFIILNPLQQYLYLVDKKIVDNEKIIKDAIKRIVEIATKHNKIIVAASDPFYLQENDQSFWNIYIETKQLEGKPHWLKSWENEISNIPKKHFWKTQDLLNEFEWLGKDLANKIVIKNSQLILDEIEKYSLLQTKLFVPEIKEAKLGIKQVSIKNAKAKYGEKLPPYIEERLNWEIEKIIDHNFEGIYWISHLLVKKSLDDNYLVGSRGSVGSSFLATMLNITEVNPLPAHYYCSCGFFELRKDVKSGFDLPFINCPSCSKEIKGDGHNIPFETFLGFEGDKIPDIDLNFSGEYQAIAHNYAKEIFGEENVFRAGTISTVQQRTAYGYVKGYLEEKQLENVVNNAEIARLAKKLTGSKRTTGQHPGGIIVVPKSSNIYDFTPINYPANKKEDWKTTHFDFHSIHDNLLKLDILGHVDPTAIRMLSDITKIDPFKIPFYDENVVELFSSLKPLKLIKELPIADLTGAVGIPEFGTSFVRNMLEETKPQSFNDLIILSGLSHGIGVYRNNSRDLIIKNGKKLEEVIGCRDDIMTYLIEKKMNKKDAFEITEFIRKGKVAIDETTWAMYKQKINAQNIPEWWVNSVSKINYLFPKAHATAYVMMAWRVAWFKVYYPLEYYSVLFALRCDFFDIETIQMGEEYVLEKYKTLKTKYDDSREKRTLSVKEIELIKLFEMVLEMYARGFKFENISLLESEDSLFKINYEKKSLYPPFVSIDGLGLAVAKSITSAREESKFISIEDFVKRTKTNKTLIENFKKLQIFDNLPQDNQGKLF